MTTEATNAGPCGSSPCGSAGSSEAACCDGCEPARRLSMEELGFMGANDASLPWRPHTGIQGIGFSRPYRPERRRARKNGGQSHRGKTDGTLRRGDEGSHSDWDPVLAPDDCAGNGECPVESAAFIPMWGDGQSRWRPTQAEVDDAVTRAIIRGVGSRTNQVSEQFILERAWTMLFQNRDLAYWAASTLTGEVPGDCLRTAIETSAVITPEDPDAGLIEIELRDEFMAYWPFNYCKTDGSGRFFAYGGSIDRKVSICRSHWAWQAIVTDWAAGSYEERQCIALFLAATLLHEIAHLCGRAMGFRHDDIIGTHRPCDYARRIEAVFGWAVDERFRRRGWTVGCNYDGEFCNTDGLPFYR